jgi:STE24 endopeptidase
MGPALIVGIAVWLIAAHALWRSSVPGSLSPPHIDATRWFSHAFLQRSASYTQFLDINALLGTVVLLAVLTLYAKRGHTLMRESAAGRIGTGMMLGMLGFGLVWLAQVPFTLAAIWWERRHGVSHQAYLAALTESWAALGSKFLFVSLALAISMALARVLRSWWWAVAAPLFVGLALLSSFLSVYLISETHPLENTTELADFRALARAEGVSGTRAYVQNVHRFTTAPNAEAVGFGSTRGVIVWDTLLDGRFSRGEIRAVLAHELGHLAHHHTVKRVGWLALFLIPAAALIARLTRRRGGLSQPEAVPVALLVLVVLQVLVLPAQNIVSRHEESEADWASLQSTHDPTAARGLFQELSRTSLSDPNPPVWSYLLYADHPTIMQRIAMTEAWQRQHGK